MERRIFLDGQILLGLVGWGPKDLVASQTFLISLKEIMSANKLLESS